MAEELALLGGRPVFAAPPKPRPRLTAEERGRVAAVLESAEWSRVGDDWPQPELDALEAEWAAQHGTKEGVAVSSGTAGLMLVLQALRIPGGDEAIVPAYGCPAVDVAVLAAGLTPIHADIDPYTYCMSPTAVAGAVTPRTAAIVAVHFAGQPAHLASLARIAERNGLVLIEDACLSPGARYEDKPVGAWGRAGVFSLGVHKPISAGEGGVVVTSDPALARGVRQLRSLGADPDSGEIPRAGNNHRLSALAAAVARPQLARLDSDLAKRAAAARLLTTALEGQPAWQPLSLAARVSRHAWAQFWLRLDEELAGTARESVLAALHAEGVPAFPGWPQPNYSHGFYTPERAGEWLRAHNSGREPRHYLQIHCPEAENAAFGAAMLLDFGLLNQDATTLQYVAEALQKVASQLHQIRNYAYPTLSID